MEVVLRHELAHLRQGHPMGRSLAAWLAPLLFWNPLYWWLAKEQRLAAELLADGEAASWIGKRSYVEELLALADWAHGTGGRRTIGWRAIGTMALGSEVHRSGVVGSGAVGTRREFVERMETLIMRNESLPTSSSLRRVVAHGLGAVLIIGLVNTTWGRSVQEPVPEFPVVGLLPELPGMFDEILPTPPGYVDAVAYKKLSVQAANFELSLDSSRRGAVEQLLLSMATQGISIDKLEVNDTDDGSQVRLTATDASLLPTISTLVEGIPGLTIQAAKLLERPVRRSPQVSADRLDQLQAEIQLLRKEVKRLRREQAELEWRLAFQVLMVPDARTHSGLSLPSGIPNVGSLPKKMNSGYVQKLHDINGSTLVQVSFGSQQGASAGMEFMVSSGATYKGMVTLVTVQGDRSTGVIKALAANQSLQVGDKVTLP